MDFETMIGQSLAEGTSPEELAKVMSDAFNKAIKQKEAAEAKAKEVRENQERDKVINAIDKTFWDHVKNQSLNMADAAALTFLVVVNDTEFGKSLKTKTELNSLYGHISNMIESVEDSYKLKKSLDGFFDEFIGEFVGDNKRVNIPNKSKDSLDGDTERCGTDRFSKPSISDRDKVMAFLRSL